MRNAIYGYLAESDNQAKAAYMREVVMPGMARLLHRPGLRFHTVRTNTTGRNTRWAVIIVTRFSDARASRRSVVPSGASVPVPSSGLLSSWSTRDWSDGIHVADLSPLERLSSGPPTAPTKSSSSAPATGSILVRGGAFFPVFMPARLAGSSLGGSFLKLRSIHVGFRLELSTDRGFIITSPVRSVAIAPAADPADIM